MLEVVDFHWSHLPFIKPQTRHLAAYEGLLALGRDLQSHLAGPAWTLLDNGEPVAAGGVADGKGWAILPPRLTWRQARKIHTLAKRVLWSYFARGRLVTADIDGRHAEAVKWARSLGFEPDTLSWPDGVTEWLCTTPRQS